MVLFPETFFMINFGSVIFMRSQRARHNAWINTGKTAYRVSSISHTITSSEDALGRNRNSAAHTMLWVPRILIPAPTKCTGCPPPRTCVRALALANEHTNHIPYGQLLIIPSNHITSTEVNHPKANTANASLQIRGRIPEI